MRITITAILFLTLFLGACQKKTSETVNGYTIIAKPSPALKTGKENRLSPLRDEQTVRLMGKNYRSVLTRQADPDLGSVVLSDGTVQIDNRIHLTLTDESGRKLLDRDFTKATFSDFMSGTFSSHAILEGMLLDREASDDNSIVYVLSVSDPQSDDNIPVRVVVLPSGQVRMEKADLMDNLDQILDGTQEAASES